MAAYPCYAYVRNVDDADARALFRGRWSWETVSAHLAGDATLVVVDDERASGYTRFRLYGEVDGYPAGLAEIEVYFSRGNYRTTFWSAAGQAHAELSKVA
jgi:hypothetical protein